MSISSSRPWRVLVVHARYQQRGGEDTVFDTETTLMESAGWQVERLIGHNDELVDLRPDQIALRSVWNQDWARRVRQKVQEFRPDVVHFHNTFPMMSPSVIWAAKGEGVATVQTLHNFRLGCLNGVLFRDGRICTDCLQGSIAQGAARGCYRGRGPSAVAALSTQIHRAIGTYRKAVDRFIVLTEASKELYARMGIPTDRLSLKPNFLFPDPVVNLTKGNFVTFAGRLSIEKGIDVLLQAWRTDPGLPLLKIIGDGPLRNQVETAATKLANLDYLGSKPRDEVTALLSKSRSLVMPSVWFEPCGMVMVEAFAAGTPVVASDFPTIRENAGDAGLFFPPGDPQRLADQVRRALQVDLRQAARRQYEERFSCLASLARLSAIYEEAKAAADSTTCAQRI